MEKTYKGSCHCGAVRFTARVDLSAGTGKCNCSICWKTRSWNVQMKPDAFELLSGEETLYDYQHGSMSIHRRFCRNCGVATHGHGHIAEMGGDFVSVPVNVLDDLDPAELLEAPVHYADGRANNWWNPPAESRHL